MCSILLISLLIGLTQAQEACPPSGINLSGIPSWTPSWPFTDAFKIRRPWISGDSSGSVWDDGRPISMDEDGWVTSLLPNQRAHTLIYDNNFGHYPPGRYVCLYEGQGQIQLGGDAVTVSSTEGRIELDVTPSDGGMWLAIYATDPTDYIRNIRLILPGFESTYQSQLFHPAFLDSLRGFDVIRFMDWQRTNLTWQHDWSDRPKPSDAGYSLGLGVPIEVMVDLCNELDADPWFCMSHLFDDAYVEQFASLVQSRLEPERTVYIEHSNEVWNGIFPQYHHAVQQANALGIPGDDDFQRAMRYHAQRSVEIFDIWDDHFPQDHLVRVMGGWHSNTWVTQQLLDWNGAYLKTDAFATAPYFGNDLGVGNNPVQTLQMSLDEILDACLASIASERVQTQSQLNVLQNYDGIELVAYESGQHLVGVGEWTNNAELTQLFIEANRHPRMYEAYVDDIEGWYGSGGGLMCAFASCTTPSRYGSWGLLEFQDQSLDEAHKMRAWVEQISNPADFDQNGQLDFFDVSQFLAAYLQGDLVADLTGDGVVDFFDVSALIAAFQAGC
jgi:hypothetical protein